MKQTRLALTFAALRATGRKALVGYLTAGDATAARSLSDIGCALDWGVDILELGVPFSDPTADGPVIQAASQRALAGGMTVARTLKLVARIRRRNRQPIILFGYANPFFRYGFRRLARDAAEAGADGFLVVDLPPEEAEEFDRHLRPRGLSLIPLIAPTTPLARARNIVRNATGFVYYIMIRGVTGMRATLPADVGRHLRSLRHCTKLPIVAGFGISTPAQALAGARHADGIVVGSALVQAARDGTLAAKVCSLRRALDGSK